jgi:hypothetical protein
MLHCACRYLTLAQAQDKAFRVDWSDPINKPVRPSLIGAKAFMSFPIEDVLAYIDWNPFFQVRRRRGLCCCCVVSRGAGRQSVACSVASILMHLFLGNTSGWTCHWNWLCCGRHLCL